MHGITTLQVEHSITDSTTSQYISIGVCVCVWPVGLAVIHDEPNVIESFVMRGADVNNYDRDGNTALLRAGYSLKRNCLHKQV